MPKNYLMLLWHMHQPFYKDLAGGSYTMPWVRLHALKDYYGMVRMLRDFPSVHVTFNLVPSLVVQLEEYASEKAKEDDYRIAFLPVEELTAQDKERLLAAAFQVNRENLLNRYPRFRELHEKSLAPRDRAAAARNYTGHDWLDLQVLSQLAWCDEIYLASDAEIARLAGKQRGYSEEDKSRLRSKEIELFKAALEEYREASKRGQIELSTSPFYHPILPLVADTDVAAESHPGAKLPRRRFRHPEDARAQLRAAAELHEQVFEVRPKGLWPSEGSVSDEVLRMAIEEGFEWAATDEGVLSRSLQLGFFRQGDGTVASGGELYRPHQFVAGDGSIALFFRDHQVSDLVGFVYSRMEAEAAAADLHQRLRAAARSTGDRPAFISVILDGENAWEFYPNNGREFLKAFYTRLSRDPDLLAVTASEALKLAECGKLTHVVPGSWINANFDIWIGAEEDNRAWDLLADARDFFAANSEKPGTAPQRLDLARQELWVAEGSDWCWWYGPEHSSSHDEEFDFLYRTHLSNIYRLLDGSPPDELAVPIKSPRVPALLVSPTGRISPSVDGGITNYFEWLGAGVYSPDFRSGSMHGAACYLEALYYGYDEQSLYLRLDITRAFLEAYENFEIRVNVDGQSRLRLHAAIEQRQLKVLEVWKAEVKLEPSLALKDKLQVAYGRIFEFRADFELLGLAPAGKVQVQIALWANELPVEVLPNNGWLSLDLTQNFDVW